MSRSIIVIGAGIGGLSTGCYGRYNGFDVDLFEMHNLPGGLCTSWRRKDYVFDGSIHHLAGTKEDTILNRVWKELGAMPANLIFPEEMVSIEDLNGNRFVPYYDPDRLEAEMKRMAPEDEEVIGEYIKGLKSFTNLDLLEIGFWKFPQWMKNIFRFLRVMKWGKVSVGDFAARFKSPIMKKFFSSIQYDWADVPMLLNLNMMTGANLKKYGWYEGGSLAFSKAIEKKYLDLGGKIHYRSRVEKIIVKNNKAVGVKLESGEEYFADYVVSNAFGYDTVIKMLEGKYMTDKMKKMYSQPGEDMRMGLHVAFGVNRDISNEPHAIVLFLDEPIEITGQKRDRLNIELYGFDKSMAPENKGVLKVVFDTDYSYWKDLKNDKEKYGNEKERLATITLKALEKRFSGIEEQVEVVDVVTPVTTERFTANGRPYGADIEMSAKDMMGFMLNKPRKLPELDTFYMIGQSVGGAGIPGCAGMGRNVIRDICKKEKKKFKTQLNQG